MQAVIIKTQTAKETEPVAGVCKEAGTELLIWSQAHPSFY